MKSISKLKDDARRHEQREEWEKAIQVYLQVLQIGEEGEGEVELPLYNRVGDLAVRLGRAKDAVRYYEQAADRYAEAGLYNNAIALCNKALRYGPDRLELLKKLGQFSASQGFLTDARRYFLEFAERKFSGGQIDDALSALEDFASVVDDAEVRELVGRKLQSYGRSREAVAELQRAFALRQQAGEQQQAEALRAEILAIDPAAVIDDNAPAPPPSFEAGSAQHTSATALPGFADIDTSAVRREPPAKPKAPAPKAPEQPAAEATPDPVIDPDAIELTGFDSGAGVPGAPAIEGPVGGIEGFESTSLDFGTLTPDDVQDLGIEREESSFDLPLLDADEDEDVADAAAAGAALPTFGEAEDAEPDVDDSGEGPTFELPLLDEPEDLTSSLSSSAADDEDAAVDLPMLDEDEDEDTRPFELPTFGDEEEEPATTSFELPSFESPSFELPSFELPSFELPDTEPPADLEQPAFPDDSAFDLTPFDAGGDGMFELPPVAAADDAAIDAAADAVEEGTADTDDWVRAAADDEWAAGPATGDVGDAVVDTPRSPFEQGIDAVFAPFDEGEADDEDEGAFDLPALVGDDEGGQYLDSPLWPDEPAAATAEETAGLFEAPARDPAAAGEEAAGVDAAEDAVAYDDAPEPQGVADTPDAVQFAPEAPQAQDAPAEPALEDVEIEDVSAEVEQAEEARAEMAGMWSPEDSLDQAPPPAAATPAPPRAASTPPADGYIDLGELLAEDEEETTRFRVQETAPTGDEDRDFAELLSQFKAKVSEHLPPEEAGAHYDLGLAFKEMGLVDEAISEFQIALRAGHMRLKIYEELGHCFLQKEQFAIAEKVLRRAMEMKFEDELELLGVYYHLGRAYEGMGRREQARDAYERVLGLDINFQDVSERLARL